MGRTLGAFALAVAMLLTTLAVAAPAVDAQGNKGGNSANAKQCQKGGWELLARTESSSVAFTSQDDCVSYGAQGGTIVAYVPPPPPSPIVTLTWSPLSAFLSHCAAVVTVTNFPDGEYPVTLSRTGGHVEEWVPTIVVVEGTGSVSSTNPDGFGTIFPKGVEFTAIVNGVSSAPSTAVC